ncbi:MAG: FixH family protein [Verrucomicrobia bacterium]|nr:FixH family protein [Verrucomicrobiota bacterium]
MNSATAKPSRNLWPHAIIAWFVIFAAALAAWITFAVRQRTDLVRGDYYEEEVHYQGQLDRLNRTAAIRSQVAINYDATNREVTLLLPAAHRAPRPAGLIHFYRPSNASLDFQVPLAVDAAGRQRIGTETLRGGFWKVRVQWRAAEHDYFFEQVIVVDEASPGLTAAPSNAK